MIIAVLLLLGLCLGSFTNALVWRVHEQAHTKAKKAPKELSITQGRSMCPKCHNQLGFWDLIPVISWLSLRGNCRYCHQSISAQYPLVELLTASLFIFSYVFWPVGWSQAGIAQFAVWLMLLTGFMALTIYDTRWQLLPNRILYPVGVLALGQAVVLVVWHHNWQTLIGTVLGVLCLGGLFYAIFQVSNGRWIGGGDVRLGVVIGLLVGGPLNAILVLFIASLLGTVVAAPSMVGKNNRLARRIAFGPFLMIATVIVYLFGASLVSWYKNRLLLL